jgi:hypothetical protein
VAISEGKASGMVSSISWDGVYAKAGKGALDMANDEK